MHGVRTTIEQGDAEVTRFTSARLYSQLSPKKASPENRPEAIFDFVVEICIRIAYSIDVDVCNTVLRHWPHVYMEYIYIYYAYM